MDVKLGNSKAVDPRRDDDGSNTFVPVDGNQVTEVTVADNLSLSAALSDIRGLWAYHSARTGDGQPHPPVWVESDSEAMATLLAAEFGCKIGRPKTWKA